MFSHKGLSLSVICRHCIPHTFLQPTPHHWTIESLLSFSCLVSVNRTLLTTESVLTPEEFQKLNNLRTASVTFRRHLKVFSFLSVTGNLSLSLSLPLLSLFQRKPTKMQLLYKSVLRVESSILDMTPLMTPIKCKYARHSPSFMTTDACFLCMCVGRTLILMMGARLTVLWLEIYKEIQKKSGTASCQMERAPRLPRGQLSLIVPLLPVLGVALEYRLGFLCTMTSTQACTEAR